MKIDPDLEAAQSLALDCVMAIHELAETINYGEDFSDEATSHAAECVSELSNAIEAALGAIKPLLPEFSLATPSGAKAITPNAERSYLLCESWHAAAMEGAQFFRLDILCAYRGDPPGRVQAFFRGEAVWASAIARDWAEIVQLLRPVPTNWWHDVEVQLRKEMLRAAERRTKARLRAGDKNASSQTRGQQWVTVAQIMEAAEISRGTVHNLARDCNWQKQERGNKFLFLKDEVIGGLQENGYTFSPKQPGGG